MRKTKSIWKLSILLFVFGLLLSSCLKEPEDPYAAYTPEREANLIKAWRSQQKVKNVKVDSILFVSTKIYYVLDTTKVGTGPTVRTGDKLTVKYKGVLLGGSQFDASNSYSYTHKDSNPDNRLIDGWEAGIERLNKGAAATFLLPSAVAYGVQGYYPAIPPNSPLIFVIEVLDIK